MKLPGLILKERAQQILKPIVIEVILIIPVILIVIVFLLQTLDYIKPSSYPVNGLLDLRNWDFKKDREVQTTGYWDFCFGEFLTYRQFDTLSHKYYTWVPGVWKRKYFSAQDSGTFRKKRSTRDLPFPWQHYHWNGEKLGATGYASYRLTVILPPGQHRLAYQMKNIVTAYRFFIDDSLVASNGTVGTSRESSKPQFSKQTVIVDFPKDTMHLTFWVSNYDYRKGGLSDAVLIGDPEFLEKATRNTSYSVLFSAGLWLAVCFILLSFYIFRTKEKYILFLFFVAVFVLLRLISADDRVITEVFPGIDFELLIKLEQISGFAMVPFSYMVMQYLFPAEFSRDFKNFLLYLILAYIAIVITTHAAFYSHLVVPFQIISIGTLFYMFYCLVLAMLHKRDGSFIIGLWIPILLVYFCIQIGFYNHLTNVNLGSNATAVGFMLAFAQIILHSKISSAAQKRVENFASELEHTVKIRTNELIEAQDKLILAARHAETERIRRRISQDIHDDISSGLNKITWLSEMVKIKALKNKPEEVNMAHDKILRIARESVDHLIDIIWSLNPNNDDLEGLFAYMRNYINRFFDDTLFNVTVNFPAEVEKVDINPELKRNLFLVMKEALNNAAKYSEARHIKIDFRIEGTSYILTVADDGIGFEEGEVRGTGNGMKNMIKRMEDINGRLKVISAPGQGTSIIVEGCIY